MDWVGFEPTTSALLGASLSKGAASRKYYLIVQIPPAPFSLHAIQYSVPSGEVLRKQANSVRNKGGRFWSSSFGTGKNRK
jgi:hypothetical protein